MVPKKVAPVGFTYKRSFKSSTKKPIKIRTTFVRKFGVKNFQKSPNLVTLVSALVVSIPLSNLKITVHTFHILDQIFYGPFTTSISLFCLFYTVDG